MHHAMMGLMIGPYARQTHLVHVHPETQLTRARLSMRKLANSGPIGLTALREREFGRLPSGHAPARWRLGRPPGRQATAGR